MSIRLIAKDALKGVRALLFANEGEPSEAILGEMVPWANEYSAPDAFVMIAPYGDFRHAKGLQRFQREDAEAVVRDFQRFANIGIRTLGIPFYKGHPDVPEFAAQGHTDDEAKGRIKELEARSNGLFGRVKWNEEGKKLIASESYHGVSPTWRVDRRHGAFHPVSLKSVGLTNEPNMPIPPILANSKSMNKQLLALLGLAETATEAEALAKVTEMANSVSTAQATIVALKATEAEYAGKKTDFANAQTELTEAQTKITTLDGEKTTLANTVTTLTTERDGLKTTFANERKAHSKAILDLAQKEGRISAADRTTYETELANEATFSNAVTRIGQSKSGLPIRPSTVNRDRNVVDAEADRAVQVHAFCKAEMDKGVKYGEAFANCQRTKPELFAQMTVPGQS